MLGKRTSTASDARAPTAGNDRDPRLGDDLGQMAIDTLAGALRNLAEFALDADTRDGARFRRDAEAWAQHVTLAAPPPLPASDGGAAQRPAAGGAPATAPTTPTAARGQGMGSAPATPSTTFAFATGRRDWTGVRTFIRDYLRSGAQHAASVTGDLRDVVWVFIRNLSQAYAEDEETAARVQREVERLTKLVEASATGELKREVEGAVAELTRAMAERRERQKARVATLDATVRTLGGQLESARREGETDPLTRVYNRKAFDEYLARSVEMHRAFHGPMSLLVLDIDRFKEINDACGHLAGDGVLREVADAVGKVFLRKADFVARFGGDEFGVVLRETAIADAAPLAERVLARVQGIALAGSSGLRVSVSIGAAGLEPGDDAAAWFARADAALYQAKAAGRGRCCVAR